MTDIMIDRTTNKRHSLHRCHYCNHEKYPYGKVIMPHDKHARRTDKGDYMCGICNALETQKILDGVSRRMGGR